MKQAVGCQKGIRVINTRFDNIRYHL